MATIAILKSLHTMDNRQFIRGLSESERRARRSGRKIGRHADHMKRRFRGVTQQAQMLRTAIGLIGGAAVVVTLSKMIREFAAFEKQLVEVGKTTNMEGARLSQLGDRIHSIAQEVPLATSRLQSLSVAAGQLGVTGVDNVAKFTSVLGKMETATDIAGEQGARSLARLLNITGESVTDVDRLGSAIVALGNNMATTEQEIVKTSTFLAAATQQFDLTSAEVVGLSAQLRAMGQRAETSGSATGAALTEINTAIHEGGEELKALIDLTGRSGEQLRAEFGENALAVLVRFSEGMSKLPAAQQSQMLEKFNLAGRETRRVIGAMIADTEGLSNAVGMSNENWEKNNALTEEAEKAAKTLSAEQQFLENQFTQMSATVGADLAPELTKIIRQLKEQLGDPQVVKGISNIASAFVGVVSALSTAIEKTSEFSQGLGIVIAQASGAGSQFPLEEEILRTQEQIRRLEHITHPTDVTRERLKALREELERLKKEQLDLMTMGGPMFQPGGDSGATDGAGTGGATGSTSGSIGSGESVSFPGSSALTGGAGSPAGGPMLMAEAYRRLGGEMAKAQDQQKARLDAIRQGMATEMELEQAHFEREQEFLATAHETLFESEAERKLMLQNLEREHQNRLFEIQAQGQGALLNQTVQFLSAMEKAQASSGAAQVGIMSNAFAQITASGAQHSKTLFEINKKAAIANAIVSTYQGAAKALSLGPWGIPLAALIIASGMAKVQAIRSQSFTGGGGAAPSTSAGGGVPAVQDVSQQGQGGGQQAQNVTIEIAGGDDRLLSKRQLRQLMEDMQEELGDDASIGTLRIA